MLFLVDKHRVYLVHDKHLKWSVATSLFLFVVIEEDIDLKHMRNPVDYLVVGVTCLLTLLILLEVVRCF
jgi:hypothetical protein